ncbi:MAG TPA: cytochrome C [Lutibacter sp.]|nr:cytochrome C [Lutibacter sp.]
MKNIIKLAVVAVLGFAMMTTAVEAGSINKGQKIFAKKLKGACGFGGAKFAASFKQAEWEKIKADGNMEEKIKEICPNIQTWEKKWEDHLFEFGYEYGKDSGNEPAC